MKSRKRSGEAEIERRREAGEKRERERKHAMIVEQAKLFIKIAIQLHFISFDFFDDTFGSTRHI